MGLDEHSFKFLKEAKQLGVDMTRIMTLGRQDLMARPRTEKYADVELRRGGAQIVHSVDVSEFEGCSHVHDLNKPLPDEWKCGYTLVLDGGTLEHVFNAPQAISNAMDLVAVGGHLIVDTPTNNWCGHGFYQFSPCLFRSFLCPSNGFKILSMVVHRVGPFARWYDVLDCDERVELISTVPMMLKVLAKKVSHETIKYPQQPDYVKRWNTIPERGRSVGLIGNALNFAKMTIWNRRHFYVRRMCWNTVKA
jgi:hypothetical protein